MLQYICQNFTAFKKMIAFFGSNVCKFSETTFCLLIKIPGLFRDFFLSCDKK